MFVFLYRQICTMTAPCYELLSAEVWMTNRLNVNQCKSIIPLWIISLPNCQPMMCLNMNGNCTLHLFLNRIGKNTSSLLHYLIHLLGPPNGTQVDTKRNVPIMILRAKFTEACTIQVIVHFQSIPDKEKFH